MRTLTTIVLLSWFVNCIVPAKLGDAYRGLLLRQRIGVSFTRTLGTIVAERLLDVVALAVLLIASGLLAFHGSVPPALRWWFIAGAGLALVGIAGLVTLMFFGAMLERLLPSRLRPHVERLREGIVGSFKRAQLPAVSGFTAAIWTLEGVRVYCVAHAFGVSLSAAQSMLVALLASLLTTFPITPAGLGAVEGGMIVALKLFDVGVTNASAIALVDRGIAYWSVHRRGRRGMAHRPPAARCSADSQCWLNAAIGRSHRRLAPACHTSRWRLCQSLPPALAHRMIHAFAHTSLSLLGTQRYVAPCAGQATGACMAAPGTRAA